MTSKIGTHTSEKRLSRKLSASSVLEAAIDLLDREGVESFSMRKLAAALDVHVSSLYEYYRSKEELLRAVVAQLMAGIAHKVPDENNWKESLGASMRSWRRILLRHNYLSQLAQFAVWPSISHTEVELNALVRAGFTTDEAVLAFTLALNFTWGCVDQEIRTTQLKQRMTDELARNPIVRIAMDASRPETVFEFGLQSLLDAVQVEQHNAGRREPEA